jgi:hypothetical protein
MNADATKCVQKNILTAVRTILSNQPVENKKGYLIVAQAMM